MCGRFTLKTPIALLRELFGLPELPDLPPRYNIAPSQPVATVRLDEAERSWQNMRWGLVPHWATDPSIGNRIINARAETLESKPAFREPFARRRCLIPADGFYEWQKLPGGNKQPWYLCLQEERPFAFAGLWDRWRSPQGEVLHSCALVTTEPNELVAPIHDRMPVMLRDRQLAAWLRPDAPPDALLELLSPPPADAMRARRVSPRVNRPEYDDPQCCAAADDSHSLSTLF